MLCVRQWMLLYPAVASQAHIASVWHCLPVRWLLHVCHWVSDFFLQNNNEWVSLFLIKILITIVMMIMMIMIMIMIIMSRYAPLGDLTSNITEAGLGEQHTKRVAKQVKMIRWRYNYNHDKMIMMLMMTISDWICLGVDPFEGTLPSWCEAGQHPRI